jgi:microcystin-dependent protein
MTLDTAYVTGSAAIEPLADIPDPVTPGTPVEAFWGNEVVQALAEHEAEIKALIPTGTIWQFAGGAAPARWALCDGTDHATVDPNYAKLFAVIGYTYGGAGATFKVPDFRAKVPAGVSGGDPAFTLGKQGGARNAPLLKHTHDMKNHTHYSEVGVEAAHTHDVARPPGYNQLIGVQGGYGTQGDPANWNPNPPAGVAGLIFGEPFYLRNVTGRPYTYAPANWFQAGLYIDLPELVTRSNSGHTHPLTRADGPNDNTTDQAGTADSASEANLPPYTTVNFIIRL